MSMRTTEIALTLRMVIAKENWQKIQEITMKSIVVSWRIVEDWRVVIKPKTADFSLSKDNSSVIQAPSRKEGTQPAGNSSQHSKDTMSLVLETHPGEIWMNNSLRLEYTLLKIVDQQS